MKTWLELALVAAFVIPLLWFVVSVRRIRCNKLLLALTERVSILNQILLSEGCGDKCWKHQDLVCESWWQALIPFNWRYRKMLYWEADIRWFLVTKWQGGWD